MVFKTALVFIDFPRDPPGHILRLLPRHESGWHVKSRSIEPSGMLEFLTKFTDSIPDVFRNFHLVILPPCYHIVKRRHPRSKVSIWGVRRPLVLSSLIDD